MYIIGKKQGNGIMCSATPAVHKTYDAANAELDRLTEQHPGVEFIIFEATFGRMKRVAYTTICTAYNNHGEA